MTLIPQIKLVFPTEAHRQRCLEFVEATKIINGDFQGTAGLENMPYETWLVQAKKHRLGIDLPSGYVPATVFLAMENDTLVGFVNIRHELNSFLRKVGGHIGYMVHPKHRKKGYATAILGQSLAHIHQTFDVKEVLVTCAPDNIGSKRTILKNGGAYENTIKTGAFGYIERYWIKL